MQEVWVLPATSTPGFSVRVKGRRAMKALTTSRTIFTSSGLKRIHWVRGSGSTLWKVSWGTSQTLASSWCVKHNHCHVTWQPVTHVSQQPGGFSHFVEHPDYDPRQAWAWEPDLPHLLWQCEDRDSQYFGWVVLYGLTYPNPSGCGLVVTPGLLAGNKGAVGVSFMFNGTSFGFVNSHLTSGSEKKLRWGGHHISVHLWCFHLTIVLQTQFVYWIYLLTFSGLLQPN